ncbi:hypothetical protein [Virgisporangium aurantiacum]|uniref:hypothetical protein n=1 Tax=Virgisporangium aurantiacum TaxID=175570 RepID=UPI00195139BB|nr:hypothetical protein [Virgisporangium aurantiacum]
MTATARPPGLNVEGIARLTRRNKMSTYHYTRTMQYEGLLQRWEPGTYTPGLAIIDLAWYLSRQLTAMNKLMSAEEIANAMHRPIREILPYLAVAADINRFSAPGTGGSAASKTVETTVPRQ